MYYLKCFGGSRTNTERTEAFVWKVLISLAPLSAEMELPSREFAIGIILRM